MDFNLIPKVFFLLTLFFYLPIKAQSEVEEIPDLHHGTLPNGFQYFIKNLKGPVEKTTMRFYVKAGFHQEDSSQLQLAHFIEHMAFKPTVNIPESINDEAQLQRLGMRIRDITGITSNQYTRYDFNIPKHNGKAFEMGLRWFRDIATNLQLTDTYINQEKGSVLQELLMGNQDNWDYFKAERNLEAKMFPFQKSYDGFLKHIQNFSHDELRDFYKKWYRADLMTLVIVGNIENIAEVEEQIKAVFSNMPKPNTAYPVLNIHQKHQTRSPQFKVQEWDEGFNAVKKEEATFFWYIRQPQLVKRLNTKEGFQEYIAFQLLSQILAYRYQEMDTSFFSDYIGVQNTYKYGGNPFSLALRFKVPVDQRQEAFKLITKKLLQLKYYGVHKQELERAKKAYLSETMVAVNSYWNEELLNYTIKNEVLFPEKREMLRKWVEELSVEQLNAYSAQFLSSPPQDIGIIAPSGNKALTYTEKEVREWIAEAYKQPIEAYQPSKTIQELYSKQEKAQLKKVKYTKVKPIIPGTEEFVLANGLRIIVKDFIPAQGVQENSLNIKGWTKRGASCFVNKDYYSALNAPNLVHYKGLKEFSWRELNNFKENSGILSCRAYIDYYESSIQARGNLSSADKLLQLIGLYFRPVHYEESSVEAWKKEAIETRDNQKNLQADFQNAIRHSVEDRAIPPLFNFRSLKGKEALEGISKTEGVKSYQIYNQIFGSPEDWTFLVTGNINIKEILPLLQTYLGNIPNNEINRATNCLALNNTFSCRVAGPKEQVVLNPAPMENVMYQASYYIRHKNNDTRWKETVKLQMLSELTEIMLKRLRHEKGFSLYNYGTYGDYNLDEERHQFSFYITCQPEELKPIKEEIGLITKELQHGEIILEHFLQAKERILTRYSSTNLRKHRNMHRRLFEHLRYNENWKTIEAYQNFINTLRLEDMIEMTNKYFKPSNKVEVIMRGEERI